MLNIIITDERLEEIKKSVEDELRKTQALVNEYSFDVEATPDAPGFIYILDDEEDIIGTCILSRAVEKAIYDELYDDMRLIYRDLEDRIENGEEI